MPLLALDLPPGFHRNGTDMQSRGRWRDGDLVRWADGAMQPVGGWTARAQDVLTPSPPRGCVAWLDNDGDRWLAAGTHESLHVLRADGTLVDITPVGLTVGHVDARFLSGYGAGLYGVGLYGTDRDSASVPLTATSWSLDTWGDRLVGCSDADGRLWQWDLVTSTPAMQIANSPVDCVALVVTGERFLFALGAGGDPRLVRWSDQEDNTVWAPSATNQAGDFLLPTQGRIMTGIATRGQTLILTDTDAHAANFLGPPFVYGFERVGTACGIVSRLAIASTEIGPIWMGKEGFFAYDGASVRAIPGDVSDYVFRDVTRAQISKIAAVVNSRFGEVWWFYPGGGSTECNRYVAFNYRSGHWITGAIDRTCGVDEGAFENPIWWSVGGQAFNHEKGLRHEGRMPFAQSGPISLGNGDNVIMVTDLIPDELTQGDVQATFASRFYPNGPETTYGPFSMANPTNVRFTGRQIRMGILARDDTDWRVGVQRLEVRQGGKR